MTHAGVQARAEHLRWQHGQYLEHPTLGQRVVCPICCLFGSANFKFWTCLATFAGYKQRQNIKDGSMDNTWNIRCLVDESYVPSAQWTRVFYCRLTDFKFWICLATFSMTHAGVQARAEHKRWQHGQLLARAIAKEVAREIQSTTYYCLKIETWGGNWSINPVFKKKVVVFKRCYKCVLCSFNLLDIQAKQ